MRFVLLLFLTLPVAAQEPVAFSVPFEPIGTCYRFERPTAAVVRDADTWSRLNATCNAQPWGDGATAARLVDFEREMIVLLYSGQTSDIQPNRATISQIERRDGAVLVWTGHGPNEIIEDELAQRRADAPSYDAQLLPLTDSLSVIERRRVIKQACDRHRETNLTSPAFMRHVYAAVLPRIDLPVVFPNAAFQPNPFAPPLDSSAQPFSCAP